MYITLETTDRFKDRADELVHTHHIRTGGVCQEKFLIEVCRYALEQSRNYIPEHLELVEGHNGTGMNNTQLDYNMVFLSAALISWAVRMQGVKSNDGQCWGHKNCSDARKMHIKIYDEWIEVIQKALDALKKGRPSP